MTKVTSRLKQKIWTGVFISPRTSKTQPPPIRLPSRILCRSPFLRGSLVSLRQNFWITVKMLVFKVRFTAFCLLPIFRNLCSPRNLCDTFASPGVPLDAPESGKEGLKRWFLRRPPKRHRDGADVTWRDVLLRYTIWHRRLGMGTLGRRQSTASVRQLSEWE